MAACRNRVKCSQIKKFLQVSPVVYQLERNFIVSSLHLNSNSYVYSEKSLIRDLSRMAKHHREQMHDRMRMPKILYDYQITDVYQRRLYAKFGKESGIDPSVSWPSKEEMKELIEDEQDFEPPLQETLEKLRRQRAEELNISQQRQQKIEYAMANLNQWMVDLQKRMAKKEAEISVAKEKKERLIEEVRQIFGYRLNPKDPKFQEALEKKEKEERKAAKEAKKKEKFNIAMAKIAAMAKMKDSELKTAENDSSSTEMK